MEENLGRIVMEEGRSKQFIKVGKRLKVPPPGLCQACLKTGSRRSESL